MTLLSTIDAFPLKLFLFGDSSFRPQLRAFPFVVLICLGTLTMFLKVCLDFCCSVGFFLFISLIIFFNTKSNNQIFHAHFLSFMLEVIFEVFPNREQFFNNDCHLEAFTQHHLLSMYLIYNHSKFFDLTGHSLRIYHFIVKESVHDEFLSPNILSFIFSV